MVKEKFEDIKGVTRMGGQKIQRPKKKDKRTNNDI